MKHGRRILAVMMAVLMLLTMMPTAMAEGNNQCAHIRSEWVYPEGEPTDCLDERPVVRRCMDCKKELNRYTEMGPCKAGDWDWDGDAPANCKEEGIWTLFCAKCGGGMDEKNKNGPHNWVKRPGKEPTCTENGWNESVCSVCGSRQDSTEKVPAFGHAWGDWTSVGSGDCTKPGKEERKCSRCGATESRDTQYGAHKFGDWYVAKKATCTEKGREERKCSVCGKTESRDTQYGAHKFGDWYVAKKATCTEKGREERKCSICGKTESRDISRLGHKWGEWKVIQEAAEGQVGIRERKCSRCGLTEQEYFYPEGTLKEGDRGEEVEDLQEELNEKGYDCGEADGIFGNNTEGALKEWQEDNGFTPDGIFWPGQQDDLFDDDEGGETPDDSKKYFVDFTMEFTQPLPDVLDGVSAGEVIELPMRIVNTGETYFNVSDRYSKDSDGNWVDIAEYPEWAYNVAPGDVRDDHYHLIITERDIELGIAVRTYEQYVYTKYYEGTDLLFGIDPKPEGHSGETEHHFEDNGTDKAMQGIQFGIPLIPSGNAEFQYATMEKEITSTPANGQYYVQGEKITFRIRLIIPEGKTLTDVEIADPLKGSNEDAVLDILPTATSADQTEYTFDYVVEAADVERGFVENTASAFFFDPEGDAWVTVDSNTVTAPTGGEVYPDGILLTKSVDGVPANGSYYQNGELITFVVRIENLSNETFTDVIIYDPILEYAELKPYDVMAPGFTDSVSFTYEVTKADADRGFVENTAFIIRPNGADAQDRIESNAVIVPCGHRIIDVLPEPVVVGGIEVVKSVTTSPANGMFYQPGETVTFRVDVTNSTANITMYDVEVTDPLMGGVIWGTAEIAPGDTDGFTFDYIVTPIDAVSGSIANVATAEGHDADNLRYVAVGNTVTVPTGMEGDFSFGVISEMSVVKEETSTPANGTYYTEGETISYKITYTNTGETEFGETLIYDTLSTGADEIAYAEKLTVGESRECYFNYVVTAADVKQGYVANAAIALYSLGGGYTNKATSNVVVSDTDGVADPPIVIPGSGSTPDDGTSGKIDWSELRPGGSTGTDSGNDGSTGSGIPAIVEDTCYVKPVTRDGDSIEYEAHFCSVHSVAHDSILKMAAVTGNDMNKQRMVWEYAYALWLKDIDAMYASILPACDDLAKITVMSERVSHLAMVANTQFALKIADPGQPAETAHTIADLWQYRCSDLCYLLNTAPFKRADSIFTVQRAQNAAEMYETCSCIVAEEAGEKILYADQYCLTHGFIYEMMELLLVSDNTAETWQTVRSLWEVELNAVYNALYKAASDEGGMAYLAEYAAYMSWLPAYEKLLTAAYPENPEIVAEVMVNTIMGRALDACERAE